MHYVLIMRGCEVNHTMKNLWTAFRTERNEKKGCNKLIQIMNLCNEKLRDWLVGFLTAITTDCLPGNIDQIGGCTLVAVGPVECFCDEQFDGLFHGWKSCSGCSGDGL